MRLLLYLANRKAKKYFKDNNFPERIVIPEEKIEELREKNAKMDTDCYTADEKLRKGIDLEKVDLEHCSSWIAGKKSNPKDKIIYYIHGGGFVGSCTKENLGFISYVVNHFKYNVYAVDYRLAPDYKCIDTISDCEDGYKYLLKHFSPENIILIGESAGGNLVLALPQKLKEDKLPLPGGIVSCSPVVQMVRYPYSYYQNSQKSDYGIVFGILEFVLSLYQGDLPADHPYISPLNGDLSNYPPVYLDASSTESLRDEARMMYVRLKEEGCDVEYHELKEFFHAEVVHPESFAVRRKEYPLILSFMNRIFNER